MGRIERLNGSDFEVVITRKQEIEYMKVKALMERKNLDVRLSRFNAQDLISQIIMESEC